jgi:hypothetical protein
LWNDILKVLVASFGSGTGAFWARAWFFITISWTTNPRNAKCVTGDYEPDDNTPPEGDRGYDPYPVVLGLDDYDPDLGWVGYQDARLLGLIMQEAISDLYHRQHLDGYHHKLEGAYRLHPGGANRVNLHCHTVANGREQDGDFIAQVLRQSIAKMLSRCKNRLNRRLPPRSISNMPSAIPKRSCPSVTWSPTPCPGQKPRCRMGRGIRRTSTASIPR